MGHDENMVLEEVEKAIKLYEECKDLDTSASNMKVSEESEEPMVLIWENHKVPAATSCYVAPVLDLASSYEVKTLLPFARSIINY